MKTNRKILSLLLCGVMLFSVCPPLAYAQGSVEQTERQSEQVTDSGPVREEVPDRQAQEVQELIDALPTLAELQSMDKEGQDKAHADLQTAYEAYEALTGEQKAKITGAEVFERLFAFFSGMAGFLDTGDDIGSAPVVITDACGDTCPGHTITGTSTTNTITVTNGIHNITLQDVNIDVSGLGIATAFSISGGAKVYLTLNGVNTLKSGEYCAGLQVPDGTVLIITADSTGGSLDATGGISGAGIGGGHQGAGGIITINGGTVKATSGSRGAGIGGGNYGAGGKITITGGVVDVSGGEYGAGIGSGQQGQIGRAHV